MYLIRHWNSPSLQHLIIKLLLLELCQLVIQFAFVDRLADRSTCNSTGNFFAQRMLFSEFLPARKLSANLSPWPNSSQGTYIVSSTLSILSLPCICCMASPARSIAARVSLLIFAASIEYICCSSVEICAVVCSRVCSCCFLRLRAALAAIVDNESAKSHQVYRKPSGSW